MFGKDKKEEFHEKILYEAQPNIIVYSKGILISMFVLGFLFFLYSAGISFIGNMNVYLIETTKVPLTRYFAIAVFICILVVIAYIILKLLIWTSIKYTITESRVIVEKGVIFQKKNYMPFNTIQDVSRSQSLLGKVFSVGTITLYSAYDGKELELKDVSSPKKIEDLIFENIRGTHLRYRNIYDDFNSNFNPIRPNSDEPTHYRRMEDLDDLELVDAKERKRQLREIKRKAKNSRNNPNYGSVYDSDYGYDDYDYEYDDYDYGYDYDDYGDVNYNPNYRDYRDPGYDDRVYRDGRVPRDNYGNNQYGSSMRRPDSHQYQYSGAIKESYSRNPDKYFANNYEEFHQRNLDAQREYDDYIQGRTAYPDDFNQTNQEAPKVEKKSGLSRFNPFSSNKKEDTDKNISDEEFNSTINQAMQDMDGNIKFKPSNDNQFRDNPHQRAYGQSHGQYPPRQNAGAYGRDYEDGYYDDYYDTYQDSRPPRGNYNQQNHYHGKKDYGSHENYGNVNRRDSYDSGSQHHANVNRSRAYSGDKSHSMEYVDANGEVDYKYKSPRESRKKSRRNSGSQIDEQNHRADSSTAEKNDGNKNPDDLLQKHSRKFRR